MLREELRARFLPRFVASARERLERARAVLAGGRDAEASVIVAELHSFAGEAALLGFDALVEASRAAEDAARRWRAADPAGRSACAGALARLARAVDRVATGGDP